MKEKKTEIELLLCCARTRVDPEIFERINFLVQKNLDWDYIIQSALRHRIMPLLYRSLEETCPDCIPENTLKHLKTYFKVNAEHNLILSVKLISILNLLKEHGILAIPFKGPVFAESVYGDIALRPFVDLDILLNKSDIIRARNLLVSNGYLSEVNLSHDQDKAYLKTEYYLTVISKDERVVIELHWDISGRNSFLPFDIKYLEDRLETATLLGNKVLQISREDLLLYLCMHGAKHCWETLDMICCVSELVRSNPVMDWMHVAHSAKRMRCERILCFGLFLARDLVGASLPEHIIKKIKKDSNIQQLAAMVYNNLFNDNKPSSNSVNSRFSSFHMKVRDNIPEKIRYGLYLTTSPTVEDWRLLPLPVSLSFLHYIIRPARLALEFARNLR